jgi:signal transduction histidine kinase/tetratricopeptide (TPR) repeat protein
MAGKPSKPTFLWQAVLILLPVAILAAIGWISLRQDKALAEQDARQRAQAIADQLLPTLQTELLAPPANQSSNDITIQVDDWGRLVSPPPCDPTPAPKPLSLAELSPEQARLWAVAYSINNDSLADAITACRQFIDLNPPKRFSAVAQFQVGVLLLQQRNWPDALKSFNTVATRYPDAIGESGLPLQALAQFKIIDLQNSSGAAETKLTNRPPDLAYSNPVDSFCSNLVYRPTLLTPYLLSQIAKANTNYLETVRKWQRLWEDHERVRVAFAAAGGHFWTNSSAPLLPVGTNNFERTSASAPAMFWFVMKSPGPFEDVTGTGPVMPVNWLATRTDHGTNGNWFICRPEFELGKSIAKDTQHLPSYFGVGVDVAGKRIFAGAQSLMDWHNEYVASGVKGAGQYWKREYSGKTSTNLLASASRLQDDAEQLKVSVFLTNPAELFATQKSRALWFGLLVIASTVAALVGLFMAARAFHRQLRLTEMKSNFVSSVSHELRAPIASVRLMAESLERGKVAGGEKQNEYYRFIVQECRRLSSLIENVLDFSRIEQGRKQYEFEPTDVAALTRQTVKLMEPYAQEKGVQLEMKTSNVEHRTLNIELEVDGRAIQQALVNLIDNAIKHSAKGQTVTIELDAGQRASGVPPDFGLNDATNGIMPVLLSVEDHGAGIPAAEHEKIFERFYRLGSELRRETQGVGIGLSIVRHIVEAHGGKVTVRSNPGQGSRFTIVLPVKNSETTDDHG